MILEYKNYVSSELVEEIRQKAAPFLDTIHKETMYNRDGLTVNITKTKELQELDVKLSVLFKILANDVVANRFKPQFSSGDSGYEYHLYRPGDICHHHADGEVSNKLLRYATVILFLTDSNDGELVFPAQNIEIKPEKGKVVVFPPSGVFSHYSKPSVEKREILMTWFIYNNLTVSTNAT